MKHPNPTTSFTCRRCGACCRVKGGIVRLTAADIARIAAALGLDEAAFIDRETALAPDRSCLVLRDAPDGACAMLTAAGACRIHAVKPLQCRTFPHAWRNPDSAATCPGLRAAAVV